MGKILSSKRNGKGIIFEVETSFKEAAVLNGYYDNIHLFAENNIDFVASISTRGKNSVTKYFLIPKSLRKNVDFTCPMSCQRIETKEKIVFIYTVDKDKKRCKN